MLYPCPVCKDVLPNKLAAIKHLTKHFDEKLPNIISAEPSHGEDCSIDILGGILCCHCNSLCRNRAEIDLHFKDEHEGKLVVYTCNVCRKPYDKYEMFGKHCYDHFARGKFQYVWCILFNPMCYSIRTKYYSMINIALCIQSKLKLPLCWMLLKSIEPVPNWVKTNTRNISLSQ